MVRELLVGDEVLLDDRDFLGADDAVADHAVVKAGQEEAVDGVGLFAAGALDHRGAQFADEEHFGVRDATVGVQRLLQEPAFDVVELAAGGDQVNDELAIISHGSLSREDGRLRPNGGIRPDGKPRLVMVVSTIPKFFGCARGKR